MARYKPIYIGSDHAVRYLGAKDKDGAFINDGTCTYSLKEVDPSAGTVTEISTGNVPYVAASSGNYVAFVDKAVTEDLAEGWTYFVDLTFSSPGGDDDFRRLRRVARYRSER